MPSSIILKAINFLLFSPGFLPGDSCIVQLLSIIHEIQTAFDSSPAVDVRGVFLDISKALIKSGTLAFYSNYMFMVLILKDCFKLSDIWVEENNFWSSTRIGVRASFVFNLHK